jgi:hypothetical protein
MDYKIVLSPELALEPADFVAAWNDTPTCRAVAEASLATWTVAQFDPTLLSQAGVVLSGVALGVVSDAVYDLIKRVLARQGVRKCTEILELEQPDGSRLLVVMIVEE